MERRVQVLAFSGRKNIPQLLEWTSFAVSILKLSVESESEDDMESRELSSSCGWLLTVAKDFSSQLINPLSREIINLPKMTTSVGNNSVFRSFFEKQKLTGPNFIDWYRQLRLVLSTEDKENYLEHPIPAAPVAQPG
ncbi:hypothetical protein Tco_1516391 [Tanacetum coccineum]